MYDDKDLASPQETGEWRRREDYKSRYRARQTVPF